jgi:predicted NUDIX family NTP pyrophosphohydrolase
LAPKRSNISAGLLMFRGRGADVELLLVHPGGPFFRNKDAGAWTIPKGEAAPGDDLLTRARIEFAEELGVTADAECFPLGSIKQKGGKTVHAWAFEGDLPDRFELKSNTFQCEWPPRSGRMAEFPEVDRAEFFGIAEARERINPAQAELLDRLADALNAAPQ